MDNLINEQYAIATKIEKLKINYNKTPLARRTRGYVTKRLHDLDTLWEKFNENDTTLNCYEKIETDDYSINKVFDKIDEIYSDFGGTLTDIVQNFIDVSQNGNAAPGNIVVHNEEGQVNEQINQAAAPGQIVGNEEEQVNVQINQPQAIHFRLPQINLPTFSGDYTTWSAFHDLFESLIHSNPNLTNVHKLHYLISNLRGQAANLLRHTSITNDSYELAWQTLTNRYNNKRVLVDAQLKLLVNQNLPPNESASSIRDLIDRSQEALNALRGLNINVSSWDPLLLFLIVQRINKDTHQAWESHLQGSATLPKFDDFILFLEARFRMLEVIDDRKPRSSTAVNARPHRDVKSYATFSGLSTSCSVCAGHHYLRDCPTFHSMSLSERVSAVKQNKICFNCLVSGHMLYQCKNKINCRTCNRRHHTLLHSNEDFNQSFTSNASNTNYYPINTQHINTAPLLNNTLPHSGGQHINPFSTPNISSQVLPSQFGKMSAQSSSPLPDTSRSTHRFSTSSSSSQYQQPQHNSCISQPSQAASTSDGSGPYTSLVAHSSARPKNVLLSTAIVTALSKSGHHHYFRALIDPGSDASFITENAAQLLRIKQKTINDTVSGIGNLCAGRVCTEMEVQIRSQHKPDFALGICFAKMQNITGILPHTRRPIEDWTHLYGLTLADPTFYIPGPIDLLLGADVLSEIMLPGFIKGPPGTPMAQETVFGWIFNGRTDASNNVNQTYGQQPIHNFHTCLNIDSRLQTFWEIEETPTNAKQVLSSEEVTCESHYVNTHSKSPDGRYIVRMPLRGSVQLGDSKNIATQRLVQLERRLSKDDSLRQSYIKFMSEYLSLGHMELSEPNSSSQRYYIPHHAVIKESSSTTKVRVVFDASCKSNNGLSLNDLLLVGPKIQENLACLLLRWRKYPFAMSADVEKMYRQILVNNADLHLQHILWRASPTEPIEDYELKTVTYGTACAPHLAVRTLQQLAIDHQQEFPVASKIALNDFYVDDVMTGSYTIQDALSSRRELSQLLMNGGFKLRKWVSNCSQILEDIPLNDREIQHPLTIDIMDTVTALGITWNPTLDTFMFKLNLPVTPLTATKRNILSEVSKIFDPLGWLAPSIIRNKILMQKLWLKGVHWDDELPESISAQWMLLRNDLFGVNQISINRWIYHCNGKIELHGFSDASSTAYAAVIYSRTQQPDGQYKTMLLTSKTRVSPIKQISIPRLELCGANLLADLLESTQKTLKIEDSKIYAWTDSTIVLHWIRAHASKWKTFVANRVSLIQQRIPMSSWRHVPTANNPADCASRGMDIQSLKSFDLWWHGPTWLKEEPSLWPVPKSSQQLHDHDEQECRTTSLSSTMHTASKNSSADLLETFSSIGRLLRVTAYCRRFIDHCRKRSRNSTTITLSAKELQNSLLFWIKTSQKLHFNEEINHITNTCPISPKSKLLSLNPFIDTEQILRVGGRLQNSDMTFCEKHPIILSNQCHLATLIIRMHHMESMHGGPQLVLGLLRKKYWIINARSAVRLIIFRCIPCHRFKASSASQLMGSLPAPRVHITRAFTHTGVDYAGPIDIRMSKGRGNTSYKGYISLFVCLSTKAIHIEAVSDLTSNGFIAAYRRFVSRRGLPAHVYSDNGTNFVGAVKILRKAHENCLLKIKKEIVDNATKQSTEWHFIPASSPHFGGLWEAGVKSLKHHLKRTIGNAKLTFEELSTLLSQIESCLNSRPLAPMTTDPNDLTAITPGHFLIGDALLSAPDQIIESGNISVASRWQLVQRMFQSISLRWKSEYLCRLQQRPKWTRQIRNIEVNDLVLIKDINISPSNWPLARVTEIHPGADGLVRVVTVRTSNSTLKRSITKVCPLPN